MGRFICTCGNNCFPPINVPSAADCPLLYDRMVYFSNPGSASIQCADGVFKRALGRKLVTIPAIHVDMLLFWERAFAEKQYTVTTCECRYRAVSTVFEVREGRIRLGRYLIRPYCPFAPSRSGDSIIIDGYDVHISIFVAISAALDGAHLLY